MNFLGVNFIYTKHVLCQLICKEFSFYFANKYCKFATITVANTHFTHSKLNPYISPILFLNSILNSIRNNSQINAPTNLCSLHTGYQIHTCMMCQIQLCVRAFHSTLMRITFTSHEFLEHAIFRFIIIIIIVNFHSVP